MVNKASSTPKGGSDFYKNEAFKNNLDSNNINNHNKVTSKSQKNTSHNRQVHLGVEAVDLNHSMGCDEDHNNQEEEKSQRDSGRENPRSF